MRKPLVAGNWKMNLDLTRGRALLDAIAEGIAVGGERLSAVEVAVCPPAVYLFPLSRVADGRNVAIGVQNVFSEPSGAYTGEISPVMAAEAGAQYAIIGHSERRHTISHGEDDWQINRKVHAALGAGLRPILCVGETLAQRDTGMTMEVLTFQTAAGLSGVVLDHAEELVLAYEPVWAIGTGRTATPQQAQEAHAHIRQVLSLLLPAHADGIRILYGGSVKADNAAALMAQPDVDGGLIGGASLEAESFLGIVEAALASVER